MHVISADEAAVQCILCVVVRTVSCWTWHKPAWHCSCWVCFCTERLDDAQHYQLQWRCLACTILCSLYPCNKNKCIACRAAAAMQVQGPLKSQHTNTCIILRGWEQHCMRIWWWLCIRVESRDCCLSSSKQEGRVFWRDQGLWELVSACLKIVCCLNYIVEMQWAFPPWLHEVEKTFAMFAVAVCLGKQGRYFCIVLRSSLGVRYTVLLCWHWTFSRMIWNIEF